MPSIRHIRQTHFYPRSPCGERLHYDNYNLHCVEISIHALLAESDKPMPLIRFCPGTFLSTLSLRRATKHSTNSKNRKRNFYPRSPCGERLHYDNYNLHCVEISIHALLAESDFLLTSAIRSPTDFYPRSPCGERRINRVKRLLPSWISIHALLAESDKIMVPVL